MHFQKIMNIASTTAICILWTTKVNYNYSKMLESKIQSQIVNALKKAGWLVIRPITISEAGYPDLFCFRNGWVVFIEVKRPGQKLRKLQEYRKRQLEEQGFDVMVVNNKDQLKEYGLI